MLSPEAGRLLPSLPSSRKATSLVKDAPTHTPGAPSWATNFPTPIFHLDARYPSIHNTLLKTLRIYICRVLVLE